MGVLKTRKGVIWGGEKKGDRARVGSSGPATVTVKLASMRMSTRSQEA